MNNHTKLPRLRNLMMLVEAMEAITNCVKNLSPDDYNAIDEQCSLLLPTGEEYYRAADWIIDQIAESVIADAQSQNGDAEITVFCMTCRDITTHRLAVANDSNYYQCSKCGAMGVTL